MLPSAAIALVVAAVASPALASALPAPLPADVSAGGRTVRSEVGSYCVNGGNAGVCADKILTEPGERHRLTVAPRMPIRIVFKDHPRLRDEVVAAAATLLRFDERGDVRGVGSVEVSKVANGWRATLPKHLHRANALHIGTSLKGGGDVVHLVGLKSVRRQPLRCPGDPRRPVQVRAIRRLTVAAAGAVAAGRGCVLRVVRIDGVDQVITEDFSDSRVNVIVRDGRVVGIVGIF